MEVSSNGVNPNLMTRIDNESPDMFRHRFKFWSVTFRDAGDQYVGLDRFGRVIDQRWHKAGTDKERVKYGFDRAGNRQWRENTVATSNQDEYYTYDGLYQLDSLKRGNLTGGPPPTGIASTPVWQEDFDYDATGNWHGSSTGYQTQVSGTTTLNQNRTHNVANEITNITKTVGTAWPNPTLDANGNMTKVPRPLDLGNSYDLKYDAWNRLVEVKPTGGSVLATYRYDGAFRRVTALISSNTRHYYYSDQWQVLEERLNALTTADKRFVWGKRYTDDLILRDNGATRHYVLHDYYNVTAIVNTSGTVLERYGYDAFGAPKFMNASFGNASSSYTWETLYGAYRYDSDTGLYQVRFRYLNPKLGRWINRDPIGEVAGTNLYAYVGNNPANEVDKFGLSGWMDMRALPNYAGPSTLTPYGNPLEHLPNLTIEDVANIGGGLGDALSLNLTKYGRDALGIDSVDTSSLGYEAGGWLSCAIGGARLAYAGLAKAGSILAKTPQAASAFRDVLKNIFRGGAGKNWRPPNLSGKTGEALRASAGRTNPGLNVYGAGVAGTGAANSIVDDEDDE